MQILSIKINKKELYYALMQKIKQDEISVQKDDKIIIPQNKTIPQSMQFLKNTFDNLLEELTPIDNVIFWCSKTETPEISMGLGILNYCCALKNITTNSKYTANITAKKLGFPTKERGNSAIALLKTVYTNCKYKNDAMRKVLAIGTIILQGKN